MVFIFKKFEDKSKKMNAVVSGSLILIGKQIFLSLVGASPLDSIE